MALEFQRALQMLKICWKSQRQILFCFSLKWRKKCVRWYLLSPTPTPIGLIPGLLSSGISRHASSSFKWSGSQSSVHRCLDKVAIAWPRFLWCDLKLLEQTICFHWSPSIWVGPPDPFMSLITLLTRFASIDSKITSSILGKGPKIMASLAGLALACFWRSWNFTSSFTGRGPWLFLLMSFEAWESLPSSKSLVNLLVMLDIDFDWAVSKRFCISQHSFKIEHRFPFSQNWSRFCKYLQWSFAFELWLGFFLAS